LSNIISQWHGYYANSYEHEWYLNQVKIERDIAKEINKQTGQTGSEKKKYEPELKLISETEAFSNLAKVYGDRTDKLNIVSTVLLALGILSLVGLLTFWAYYPAPSSNYSRAHNMAKDEAAIVLL
jgi:hypothetical protein